MPARSHVVKQHVARLPQVNLVERQARSELRQALIAHEEAAIGAKQTVMSIVARERALLRLQESEIRLKRSRQAFEAALLMGDA
jgi:hypothetical protein